MQQFSRLDLCFGHGYPIEIVLDKAKIDLVLSGLRTVAFSPFAHLATHIVAVPETAVEDCGKTLFPAGDAFLGIGSVGNRSHSLLITLCDSAHIIGTPPPPFNLQHTDAGLHYLVEEVNGTEVFRRHNIFVVDHQLHIRFEVLDQILATAKLETGAAVGTVVVVVEREIALAAHRHT